MLHTFLVLSRCTKGRFNRVEPSQTQVWELCMPYYLSNNEVQIGSKRFDAIELCRTSPLETFLSCTSSKIYLKEIRWSWTTPNSWLRPLALYSMQRCGLRRFEEVRYTWTTLNYTKLELRHAEHFACPVKVYQGMFRYSRTTPNTSLSGIVEGSRAQAQCSSCIPH